MVRRALIVLCVGFMCIFAASCGQTYQLQSITVAPSSPGLEGISQTLPLKITAHFSNTKTEDVTAVSTYALASTGQPIDALSVSPSGILSTSTLTPACTWKATLNPDGKTYSYSIVEPYQLTVTYHGVTAMAAVTVDSAATCYDPTHPAPPPA